MRVILNFLGDIVRKKNKGCPDVGLLRIGGVERRLLRLRKPFSKRLGFLHKFQDRFYFFI